MLFILLIFCYYQIKFNSFKLVASKIILLVIVCFYMKLSSKIQVNVEYSNNSGDIIVRGCSNYRGNMEIGCVFLHNGEEKEYALK